MTTLSDVARAAGVSLATASRALNGSGNRVVHPDLRDRVITAARELNYRPNVLAQAMARGRSSTVALVVSNIADPFFSILAAGVTQAARGSDAIVTLTSAGNTVDERLPVIELLHGQRARAVILAGGLTASREDLERMRESLERVRSDTGLNIVSIGQSGLGVHTLLVPNREASGELAKAMLELGYRRFGLLIGPDGHQTAVDRQEGFRDAVLAGGGEVLCEIKSGFTRDAGFEAMAELLALPQRPEIVFAPNDVAAAGALARAREDGVRVPGDIAVCAFDDIPGLRDLLPSLTTVRIDLEWMGEQGFELAMNSPGDKVEAEVPYEVIVRASTPRLNG